MKNKKGFVFVETLIVVAVLTASLLMLYSTYSAVIRKEKTRIRYNDATYLYRTYYTQKFLRDFEGMKFILENELYKDDPENQKKPYIRMVGCNDLIPYDTGGNRGFCETLIQSFHIRTIFLTYNDLSPLQKCTNTAGICEALISLGDVDGSSAEYLKTIGSDNEDGYRIILEFAEKKDGSFCGIDDHDCVFYYATLQLKGVM